MYLALKVTIKFVVVVEFYCKAWNCDVLRDKSYTIYN